MLTRSPMILAGGQKIPLWEPLLPGLRDSLFLGYPLKNLCSIDVYSDVELSVTEFPVFITHFSISVVVPAVFRLVGARISSRRGTNSSMFPTVC
jgi:hypothetical protein